MLPSDEYQLLQVFKTSFHVKNHSSPYSKGTQHLEQIQNDNKGNIRLQVFSTVVFYVHEYKYQVPIVQYLVHDIIGEFCHLLLDDDWLIRKESPLIAGVSGNLHVLYLAFLHRVQSKCIFFALLPLLSSCIITHEIIIITFYYQCYLKHFVCLRPSVLMQCIVFNVVLCDCTNY